jgi:hypothetical protein
LSQLIKPPRNAAAHPGPAYHVVIPFVIAMTGVLLDYVTTTIGVSVGFREAHPQYHPVWGVIIFSLALVLLTLSLPRRKWWSRCITGVALCSYLGPVNNALVLLGIFS